VLELSDLPGVNATLNGISAAFLVAGFVLIKQRRWRLHKRCMLGALAASSLFLISYVIYHANVGSRPFAGTGPVRIVYFTILITHVVLATVILPLALVTTARGLREQYGQHVKVARWTLPLWLYVSVTGVIIYLMLYQLS
jgi:putative membrane protein